jgi:MFS family permease
VISRLGALGEPNFRRLWIAQSASAAGDGLTGVALTFAVLMISNSATDLGIVLTAFMGPRVAFMVVGGVWADRLPRKLVMIGSDLVRAAAQLAIAMAVFSGTRELWPYIVASAVSGGASAFFQPAVVGLLPQTVSPGRLQDANALLSLSQSFARLGGPVIAGLAVAGGVIGYLFIFDTISFLFSALMLATLNVPRTVTSVRQSFLGDLADGWRQVISRRWLVVSLGAFAFANLSFAAFFVLGPVIVQRDLGGAPDWGLLMGLFSLGGLSGAAIAMRWHPDRPLFAGFSIFLIVPAVLVLLAVSPPLAVLALGTFAAAAATSLTDTLWHTTLQQQVSTEHLSRVSSFDWTVSMMIFPLGSAVAGPLADVFGPNAALTGLALIAGIPLALTLFAPSVRAIKSIATANDAADEEVEAVESLPAAA